MCRIVLCFINWQQKRKNEIEASTADADEASYESPEYVPGGILFPVK